MDDHHSVSSMDASQSSDDCQAHTNIHKVQFQILLPIDEFYIHAYVDLHEPVVQADTYTVFLYIPYTNSFVIKSRIRVFYCRLGGVIQPFICIVMHGRAVNGRNIKRSFHCPAIASTLHDSTCTGTFFVLLTFNPQQFSAVKLSILTQIILI